MTTTARPSTTVRTAGYPTRNHARAAGIFYLLTFAASLPAFALVRSGVNPDLTIAAGHENRMLWVGLLEFITAVTCIGSAVALFPVLKRQNEALALGFVTSRVTEAAIIMAGVLGLLAAVTLQQSGTAGGQGLVAIREWAFLFGPGFMACLNAVLLGTLMYRSGLVPRFIPTMGLIGAPLLMAANLATLFGHNEQTSAITMLATIPVGAWELSVGTWMLVKGFKPAPVIAGLTKVD